jgi:transcriptional regulator with XRE-family HTH domain
MASYTSEERAFLQQIGNKIKDIRSERGLSQEQLSFDADLDRTYIGSVERGERNISIINLNKIANALNFQISEFFKNQE